MRLNTPSAVFRPPTLADLRVSAPPRLCFFDVGDHGDFHPPHPAFFTFCCKQRYFAQSTLGWPLRDACVTLGWPLGHPIPIPIPIPSRQRVVGSAFGFSG